MIQQDALDLVAKKVFEEEFDLSTGFQILHSAACHKSRAYKGDEKHSALLIKTEEIIFEIKLHTKSKDLLPEQKNLSIAKLTQGFIFPSLKSLGAQQIILGYLTL